MEQAPSKQSKELSSAIYDDWKRKVVDEAKKRAVAQNVDYDTFKNMVSVAHLKPIQAANSIKRDVMLPSWKFNAEGSVGTKEQQESAEAALTALLQKEPSEVPSTSGDFYREWRRCPSPDAKYRYLHLCGPTVLASLFVVEISSDALKDIVNILESCWLGHAGAVEEGVEGSALKEASFVFNVLAAVKRAGRFSLTIKLSGPGCKKVLESLFAQLDGAVEAFEAIRTSEPSQTALDPLEDMLSLIGVSELKQLKSDYGL